jgi:hypothetical protein
MLFGEYVSTIWWPAWKSTHPRSAHGTRSKLNTRILPHFGDLPLTDLDADAGAAGQWAMTRRRPLPPHDRDLPVACWHHFWGSQLAGFIVHESGP